MPSRNSIASPPAINAVRVLMIAVFVLGLTMPIRLFAACSYDATLLTTPDSAETGQTVVFNTYPINNQMCSGAGANRRYSIDFDGDGSYDCITPWTGCYTSACKQACEHAYTSAGNYTAKARIEWGNNDNGTVVEYTTKSVTVSEPADTTLPTLNSVQVPVNEWVYDGTASYDIVVSATDNESGIDNIRMLINYLGTNSANRRGYFAWRGADYTFGGSSTDRVACSGGGFADKYMGPSGSPPGFGKDYVTLVGCSASTVGNTHTVTFTVRPHTDFGDFTNNDVSLWAIDKAGNTKDWVNYDTNFTSTAGDATLPVLDSLEIPVTEWKYDGTAAYDIVLTASDNESGLLSMQAMINYVGDNQANRRGYFSWKTDDYKWPAAESANRMQCQGGGYAEKYNGTGGTPEGWGKAYVTLLGCSTSITGNSRTVTLTVQPHADFGDFTNNDIAFLAEDNELNNTWANYDLDFISIAGDATPPAQNLVEVSRMDWVVNSDNTYDITVAATDTGSGVNNVRALINLQGENNANRRGYFAWREGTYTFSDADSADRMACDGGGYADKYNGTNGTPVGYGKDYVSLVGCSTTVDASGERTVTFTVLPHNDFGEFVNNDVSLWGMDTVHNTTGWINHDVNFSSRKSVPYFISIGGYDGFSYEINPARLPHTEFLDLIIANNSSSELLIINCETGFVDSEEVALDGVITIFNPQCGSSDNPGFEEIPPELSRSQEIEIRIGSDAKSGNYQVRFTVLPENSIPMDILLDVNLTMDSDELTIDDISVRPGNLPLQNPIKDNGEYTLSSPVFVGEEIGFDILNDNTSTVYISGLDSQIVNAPPGSNLSFDISRNVDCFFNSLNACSLNPTNTIGDPGLSFSGLIDYATEATPGPFEIILQFVVSDTSDGFGLFQGIFTFSLKGELPGTEQMPEVKLVMVASDVVSSDNRFDRVLLIQSDSKYIGRALPQFDEVVVFHQVSGDGIDPFLDFEKGLNSLTGSTYRLSYFVEKPDDGPAPEIKIGGVKLRDTNDENKERADFCLLEGITHTNDYTKCQTEISFNIQEVVPEFNLMSYETLLETYNIPIEFGGLDYFTRNSTTQGTFSELVDITTTIPSDLNLPSLAVRGVLFKGSIDDTVVRYDGNTISDNDNISLGSFQPGSSTTRFFEICNNGIERFSGLVRLENLTEGPADSGFAVLDGGIANEIDVSIMQDDCSTVTVIVHSPLIGSTEPPFSQRARITIINEKGNDNGKFVFIVEAKTAPGEEPGNFVLTDPAGNPLNNNSTVDFGEVQISELPNTGTFTITNTGSGDLALSKFTITGNHYKFLSTDNLPTTNGDAAITLPAGGTKTFGVQLKNTVTAAGEYAGAVSIEHDATNLISPLTLNVETTVKLGPQISVGSPVIAEGGSYDMGNVEVGMSLDAQIPVRNTGDKPLVVSDVTLTAGGSSAGEFSVLSMPGTVQPGTSGFLKIRFQPDNDGLKTASVAVTHNGSNDPDGSYVFNITATADPLAPAEMIISYLNSGGGSPSTVTLSDGGSFNFGSTLVGTKVDQVFYISNPGDGETLSLTSVSVGGAFSVRSYPASVPANGQGQMIIRFDPSAGGNTSKVVTIRHNASNVSGDFTFTVSGTGIPVIPEIDISGHNGGRGQYFGAVAESTLPAEKAVVITNNGNATLTLSYQLTGAGFTLTEKPASIAPGQSGILRIQLNGAVGSYQGELRIIHNADNEASPFVADVTGTIAPDGGCIPGQDCVPSGG